MRKIRCIVLAIPVLLISCSKEPGGLRESEEVEPSCVAFTLPELKYIDGDGESGTSTKVTVNGENKIVWVATDTVGIYPDSGSQVYFSLSGSAGSQTVMFDGGGWAFKSTSNYYAYYPFIGDIYLDRSHIPVAFNGQRQTGKSNIDHIGRNTYMHTFATKVESGSLMFGFNYLSCVIRPLLTLPEGTYTKMAITAPSPVFISKGHYDLSSQKPLIIADESTNQLVVDLDDITVDGQESFRVYLCSAPVNLKNVEITVSVINEQKKEFQCKKTPSAEYVGGAIAGLTCTSWTEVPQSMGLIINDWEDGGSISGGAE